MVHQGLVKTQVLFLYHCGILRAIARVALQPNPCGLTLRFCDIQGTPKDTFVLLGKRSTQAKEWALSPPDNAILKAQCATLPRYYAFRLRIPYGTPKRLTKSWVFLINTRDSACYRTRCLATEPLRAGIKKVIKKTRYCESFLCFRKFISCKRQSTRQSLSTFQVRESRVRLRCYCCRRRGKPS